MSAIIVEFDKANDRLHIAEQGGWQSRHAATSHLFLEALRTVRPALRSFRVVVFTGDRPANGAAMAYCRRDGQNVIAIPDYLFWYWPEIGVPDYSELTKQMVRSSASLPVIDKLFWIGNVDTHPSRKNLVRLAAERDDMRIESMGWQGGASANASESRLPSIGSFFSLPDHCRYKYLLDMQGVGHSGRLKVLLFSGRPVFVQDRPWKEYFHDMLVPFEHYIPVEESLGDLTAKLEWARKHPSECEHITVAAQNFAAQNLTREAAVEYLRRVLAERYHHG